MKAVRESLNRRKTELEKLKSEQEQTLRLSVNEEKAVLDKFARGESRREDLQAITSYRTALEKTLSETCLLIKSLEDQLAEIPIDDFETPAAAEQGAFLAKFGEIKNNIVTSCLPELRRAFVAYHLSGNLSQWPNFILEVIQFRQPKKDEFQMLKAKLEKEVLGGSTRS